MAVHGCAAPRLLAQGAAVAKTGKRVDTWGCCLLRMRPKEGWDVKIREGENGFRDGIRMRIYEHILAGNRWEHPWNKCIYIYISK